MNAFPRIVCPRWEDLVRAFENFEGWIFRGHCSANWLLQSTLERRAPTGHRRLFTEHDLAYEFRRRAHNYLGVHQLPTTLGEWLALMQHFGAPTRLVDFAFAFCRSVLRLRGPAGRWLWQLRDLGNESGLVPLATRRSRVRERWPFWIRLGRTRWHDAFKAVPPSVDAQDDFLAGALLSKSVEIQAQTSTHAMVAIFEPDRLTDRMSAQQGVFLWPGNVDLTVMENLSAFGDPTDGVRLLTVPLNQRGRALEQLRLMNITRTSLFPGLEGFAQSFRQLPVREPKEEPVHRAALRGLSDALNPPSSQEEEP